MIDIKTLMLSQISLSVLLSFTFLVYLKYEKTFTGFRLWTVGTVIHAVGYIFLSSRGLIPIGTSIVFGNLLLMVSLICRMDAILRFLGVKPFKKIFYFSPLLAIAIGSYFYFIQDNMAVRSLVFGLFFLIYSIPVVLELMRHTTKQNNFLYYLTATIIVVRIASLIIRAVYFMQSENNNIFANEIFNSVHFLIAMTGEVGINIVFLLMNSQKSEDQLIQTNDELQKVIDNVKTLSGLLPICSHCKKIRDDKGYWNQIEGYIQAHSDAEFSHGMCPECSDDLYGKENWYIKMKKKKQP